MTNQTTQNGENNRGENEKEALLDALRSIWQEIMYTDRTFFERSINEAAIHQVRHILDEI